MVVAELPARTLDLGVPWVVRDLTPNREVRAMVTDIDAKRGPRFVLRGYVGRLTSAYARYNNYTSRSIPVRLVP